MARVGTDGATHARLAGAVLVVGASMVVFVGYDGSPAWRLARVTIVALLTTMAVIWQARAGTVAAGRMAGVVGATAVVTGAGFVPHLVKGGSTPLAAAAVAASVTGIILLVAGLVLVSRQRPLLGRLAMGAGGLVALVVAGLTLSPPIIATNVPRPELGATPASRDLAVETVDLTTRDGVTLAAWYVPSSNGTAVVLRHGAGSTRSSVLDHAAVLAGNGFGVLMVDARGHGESGGRAMDFGWFGDEDIDAAVTYLTERPDVDPARIGAVGLSMGGEEAIGAAAGDPRLGAVVAEGATARVATDEEWLSAQYGWRGLVQEQLEVAQDAFTDVLTSASPPIALRDAVSAADGTEFLLVAAEEVAKEVDTLDFIVSAAPERVQTWVVPESGHTGGLRHDPDQWEAQVVGFLSQVLSEEAAS